MGEFAQRLKGVYIGRLEVLCQITWMTPLEVQCPAKLRTVASWIMDAAIAIHINFRTPETVAAIILLPAMSRKPSLTRQNVVSQEQQSACLCSSGFKRSFTWYQQARAANASSVVANTVEKGLRPFSVIHKNSAPLTAATEFKRTARRRVSTISLL